MHTIKITPNLLLEYQIAESNRKKIDSVKNRIESNRNFFLPELDCSTRHGAGHERTEQRFSITTLPFVHGGAFEDVRLSPAPSQNDSHIHRMK